MAGAVEPVGDVFYGQGTWTIKAEPHVIMRLKRIFPRADKSTAGEMAFADTPEICREIEWCLTRWPMRVRHLDYLTKQAEHYRKIQARMERVMTNPPAAVSSLLALPARPYQEQATSLYLMRRALLIGDDLGTGKSLSALASFRDARTIPGLVVCPPAIQRQWRNEIQRFLPNLFVHIIRKSSETTWPEINGRGPDVLITTYHKLNALKEHLAAYCSSVIFDEVQELRHASGAKYSAAKLIAKACKFRAGLSATPIFGLGGEMYYVLNILFPDALGTWTEFVREWCGGSSDRRGRATLIDPDAFGQYLRREYMMIRRTRQQVGRELPALTEVVQPVDSDLRALSKIEGSAAELAKIVVNLGGTQSPEARRDAALELTHLVRQQTGIAKTPFVCDFVQLLVESGEKVLLLMYHRETYDIIATRLRKLHPAFYTGTENANAKAESVAKFSKPLDQGGTDLLVMSVRSAVGLDGLQRVCRTVVVGELDWAPGVHAQAIGRVHRDGQANPVLAYYLLAEDGSDPVIAKSLGLKREQVHGLMNPGQSDLRQLQTDKDRILQLARYYLEKKGIACEPSSSAPA